MNVHRRTVPFVLVLAAILLSAMPAHAQLPPPPGDTIPPTSITGVLTIDGCTPSAGDIVVRAVPMLALGPSGRSDPREVRMPARSAAITSTRNLHQFTFTVDDLQPGGFYRLRIGLTSPGECGRVFWRAASRALVVAGSAPVTVEGYAARTQTEVRDLRTGDWLGADDLRFDDRARSTRTIRWRSTLPGIVAGQLQLSTEAFPTRGAFNPCDLPAKGIVYRQTVPVRPGAWATLQPLDFGRLLSPFPGTGLVPAPARVSTAVFERLMAGFPLYARVVPLRADGPACDAESDGVVGNIVFARLPGKTAVMTAPSLPSAPRLLGAGFGQHYAPPSFGDGPLLGHPTVNETAFKVTKPHLLPFKADCVMDTNLQFGKSVFSDPLGCQIVLSNKAPEGYLLGTGEWFYFGPPESTDDGGGVLSDAFEELSGIVTGFVNAVGFGVTALSDLVESVKQAVADVVTDVIMVLPILSNACAALDDLQGPGTCEGLVKTGLETGLVAMGLPPSLPNWEQLKDQGIDYLASEIASQTGVPSELTEAALHELAERAIDAMTVKRNAALGPQYDWVVPYGGFDPASWTVNIAKKTTLDMPGVHLLRQDNALFSGTDAPLPTKFPASNTLNLPLVLQPNLAGIPAPTCVRDVLHQVTCTQNLFGSVPACYVTDWVGTGFDTKLYEVDCGITNWPATYYRDAWISQKFQPSDCVNLRADSMLEIFGNPIAPFPYPPLTLFARVRPSLDAGWDGPFFFQAGCSAF